MRTVRLCLAIFTFCKALSATDQDAAKAKRSVEVLAVTHAAQVNERRSSYTTPGNSMTTCNTNGSATAVNLGGMVTANGSATSNCQTTSTPAQTHEVTRRTVQVRNVVEAEGMRYTIACTAGWAGSNCSQMVDGDVYRAEIEGTTMWVAERRGGNQGKPMRVKYKVLDIRPAPATEVQQATDPAAQRFAATIVAAKQRHPDFDAVTNRRDLPTTPAMKQAVFESEVGGELIYWLGEHPDECRRIAALTPTATILELGKVSVTLAQALK